MRHYTIYTLEDDRFPKAYWRLASDNLDEQREYKAQLEKCNPQRVFWIRDNQTGHVVF